MEIIGRQIELGVAIEASRGVAESTADRWGRKVNANITERAVHAVDDSTRGRLEDGEGRRVAQRYIEGEVEGPLHIDALGYYMANVYGMVVTSTVTGAVRQHIFNLAQNIQHPSLTFFAKDGSVQNLALAGGMVNTFQLIATQEDLVRFNSSVIAQIASASSDTPSYGTEFDFVARDITVKMADSSGGIAGATPLKVKELDITWDQGLIRDHVVGSYNPDDVYNARLMVTGNLTLNFQDEVFKDMYLGNDRKYMEIKIEGEATLATSQHPTFTLLLNAAQIMDWNRSGAPNELVTETIAFQAFFNANDQKASQVTLKNLTASYDNVPSA